MLGSHDIIWDQYTEMNNKDKDKITNKEKEMQDAL